MTNKQIAWEKLIAFKKLDLSKKTNFISAKEIKAITKQEPRIMAKFDSSDELPPSFIKSRVFILPVKNSEYVILKGNGFHKLEKIKSGHKIFKSRLPFELVSHAQGISEMQHIDYAYNSGLVEEFASQGNLYLTIRGRKFSPAFYFKVDGSPVLKAESVQVEVDAGFEGKKAIVVMEGKINTPIDFIIRQLYYPFRFWREIVPEKEVLPIFFTFNTSTKHYNFWQYTFRNINDYESIQLIKSGTYQIQTSDKPTLDIEDFANLREKRKKKSIIPQADDIKKILEFPFRIFQGMNNSGEIAKYFEFDQRQSSYYREATEALGLVELINNKYFLTDIGKAFVELPVQERNELLARLMFELPIMHEVLMELLIKPSKFVSKEDIARIVEANSNLSGSTVGRRAQTLLAWFRWLHQSVGILKIEKNGLSF